MLAVITFLDHFSNLEPVDDRKEAEVHMLKLWRFLPLNPPTGSTSLPLQKEWFMIETENWERRGINRFLYELVARFCSNRERLDASRLPLAGGGVQWSGNHKIVEMGVFQLLLKRHLLETPLRLWPQIFNNVARPKDYEASILASKIETSWKNGSPVVTCKGNGGFEISRLWVSMVDTTNADWSVEGCPEEWKYYFTQTSDFYNV